MSAKMPRIQGNWTIFVEFQLLFGEVQRNGVWMDIYNTFLNLSTAITDIMDWMLTHQLSSKNLSVGEKLAMTEEFKKEVSLENERKKSKAVSESNRTRNSNPLQLECDEKTKERSETWTDNQIAKKAGVGTGSVARYDKIMKSDRELLLQKSIDLFMRDKQKKISLKLVVIKNRMTTKNRLRKIYHKRIMKTRNVTLQLINVYLIWLMFQKKHIAWVQRFSTQITKKLRKPFCQVK